MIKKAKQDNWKFCLMPCESMKKEQIHLVIPRDKAKLEKNIYVCKSTKNNKSYIRCNRSIIMPRGLSPTRKQGVKIIGRTFCDLERFQRDSQFKYKYLAGNIYVMYLSKPSKLCFHQLIWFFSNVLGLISSNISIRKKLVVN